MTTKNGFGPFEKIYCYVDSDGEFETYSEKSKSDFETYIAEGDDNPLWQRTPFVVEFSGSGPGVVTAYDPPKPDYWYEVTGDGCSVGKADAALQENLQVLAQGGYIRTVYRKDDNGNLIKVDDDEKARAIEAWKNS